MEHLKGFDRQQAVLFPTAIDDMVDKKNPVQVIDTTEKPWRPARSFTESGSK